MSSAFSWYGRQVAAVSARTAEEQAWEQQGDGIEVLGAGKANAANDLNKALVCGQDGITCSKDPPPKWIVDKGNAAKDLKTVVPVKSAGDLVAVGDTKEMKVIDALTSKELPARMEFAVLDRQKGGFEAVQNGYADTAVVRHNLAEKYSLLVHFHPVMEGVKADFLSVGDKNAALNIGVPNAAWSATRNTWMVFVPNANGTGGTVYGPGAVGAK